MKRLKSKKVLGCIVIFVLLLCCCITSIVAYGAYAFNSNTNIPQTSDLIEKLETALISDSQFDDIYSEAFATSIEKYDPNKPDTSLLPADYKGFSADMNFEITGEANGTEMTVEANGTFLTNRDSTAMEINTDLNIDFSGFAMTPSIELKGFQQNGKTESFVKISKLPALLTMMVPQIAEMNNKWIYSEGETQEVNVLDDKTKNNLVHLVRSQEFKNIISRRPDRVIGDVRNYCIAFNANNDHLTALMNKYSEISGEKVANQNGEFTSELCYGRRSVLPSLIEFEYTSSEAKVKFSMNNFKYPAEVNIQKPEDYIDGKDFDLNTLSI